MSQSHDSSTNASGPSVEAAREFYPSPVVHGVGLSCNFSDTGIYDALRELWYDRVGGVEDEPNDGYRLCNYQPDFLPDGEYAVFLSSSGWMAGVEDSDSDYTQYYEYILKLREKRGDNWVKPPISLKVEVAPQTGELVYPDGNDFPLPFGEGSLCKIQTTYPNDGHEAILRGVSPLSEVVGCDVGSWISDSARITKLETHLRFDIDRKDAAVECLQRSEGLIAWGGGAEIDTWRRRQEEGWLEARTRSDRWDLLGFEAVDYTTQIKIYQAGDWHKRSRGDPLHHPKIESEYQQGKRDAHPTLDEWDTIVAQLRDKVVQHAQWSGIEPSDLVADDFYDGAAADLVDAPCLEGRRDDLRARYDDLELPVMREVSKTQTKAPYDIISVVKRHDGATYDTLEEETGLSRSCIRYHVRRFAELGFVERISNPVLVVFASPYVGELVEEAIEKAGVDTVGTEDNARQERRDERIEAREGSDSDTDSDDGDEPDEQSSSERALFQYICDVGVTPEQLSGLIAAGVLTEQDVRVRDKPELEAQASAIA